MAEFGSGDSPTPTPSLAHVLVDEIEKVVSLQPAERPSVNPS